MGDLRTYLDSQDYNRVLAVEPGGNPGDGLIYRGWYKIADELGLNYKSLGRRGFGLAIPVELSTPRSWILGTAWLARLNSKRLLNATDAVYIHGSGGFNDIWKGTIHTLKMVDHYFDCPIIVGPQSAFFEETDPATIFEDLSNPVQIFVREKYSYQLLEPVVDKFDSVDLDLSPDTATHLEAADFSLSEQEDHTLHAFRDDAESYVTEDDIPQDSENVIREDIAQTAGSVDEYMDAIARAAEVHTDRLHVGIGASILETPVTLYDNFYHKSRGVYEYSLSDYPLTKFRYLRPKDEPVAAK